MLGHIFHLYAPMQIYFISCLLIMFVWHFSFHTYYSSCGGAGGHNYFLPLQRRRLRSYV